MDRDNMDPWMSAYSELKNDGVKPEEVMAYQGRSSDYEKRRRLCANNLVANPNQEQGRPVTGSSRTPKDWNDAFLDPRLRGEPLATTRPTLAPPFGFGGGAEAVPVSERSTDREDWLLVQKEPGINLDYWGGVDSTNGNHPRYNVNYAGASDADKLDVTSIPNTIDREYQGGRLTPLTEDDGKLPSWGPCRPGPFHGRRLQVAASSTTGTVPSSLGPFSLVGEEYHGPMEPEEVTPVTTTAPSPLQDHPAQGTVTPPTDFGDDGAVDRPNSPTLSDMIGSETPSEEDDSPSDDDFDPTVENTSVRRDVKRYGTRRRGPRSPGGHPIRTAAREMSSESDADTDAEPDTDTDTQTGAAPTRTRTYTERFQTM